VVVPDTRPPSKLAEALSASATQAEHRDVYGYTREEALVVRSEVTESVPAGCAFCASGHCVVCSGESGVVGAYGECGEGFGCCFILTTAWPSG